MKFIDFLIQTTLIALTLVFLALTFRENGWASGLLGMQLLVGAYQVLSSITSVILKTPQYKLKGVHLGISFLYLIVLFAIGDLNPGREITLFLFIAPAWLLAIYYYALTCLSLFRRPKSGGRFLPHLSF